MTYRILSLDGGGTWALIQVKALIKIYGAEASGHYVLGDFDLIAANSGGSIVLGELVENTRLGDILAFFEDEEMRRSVFSPTANPIYPRLHRLFGIAPKYSARNKLPALREALPERGDLPLPQAAEGIRSHSSDRDVHLLLTTFDYDRHRAKFARSAPATGPHWGTGEVSTLTLAEAIHASTNAPVNYFDEPATFRDHGGRFWDGAIAACNNPVLAAVSEAIALGQDPSDIRALSIGTASVVLPCAKPGDPPSPYIQPIEKPGLFHDLRTLALAILDDPPDAATYMAHLMTCSGIDLDRPPADSRVVRMNPLISPVKRKGGWEAPGAMTEEQFTYLKNLDIDAIVKEEVEAISDYAVLWLDDTAPNQPIRINGEDLSCELGQSKFSSALAAWQAIA